MRRHNEPSIGAGDGGNELLFDIRSRDWTGFCIDGGGGRGLRVGVWSGGGVIGRGEDTQVGVVRFAEWDKWAWKTIATGTRAAVRGGEAG